MGAGGGGCGQARGFPAAPPPAVGRPHRSSRPPEKHCGGVSLELRFHARLHESRMFKKPDWARTPGFWPLRGMRPGPARSRWFLGALREPGGAGRAGAGARAGRGAQLCCCFLHRDGGSRPAAARPRAVNATRPSAALRARPPAGTW